MDKPALGLIGEAVSIAERRGCEPEVTCSACHDTGRDIIDDEYCACEMGLMLEEADGEENPEDEG